MRAALGIVLLASIHAAVVPSVGRADPPRCTGTAPSDAEVGARLQWIERRVADHEDDVRRWYTGFAILHALLGAVNTTLALAAIDDEARIDSFVNAGMSFLGLVSLAAATPPILGAGDALRALPRRSPEERRLALRTAERRLEASAAASAFVRGWFAGTASAVAVGSVGASFMARGRPGPGLVFTVGATVLSQGRLLLHPTGVRTAWRVYRARHADAGCEDEEERALESVPPAARTELGLTLAPAAHPRGAGIALSLTF